MRIGIDLDGVVADFNRDFMDLMVFVTDRDQFGTPRPPITCWNYPVDQFGYTKAEFSFAWQQVERSDHFWRQLAAYDGALAVLAQLDALADAGHDIYYITSRPGKQAKLQTEGWLNARGVDWPTVLISSAKGACAKALNLDLYIDDKTENCQDVREQAPTCQVLMATQPWNRELPLVPRIDLTQFLAVLKEIR